MYRLYYSPGSASFAVHWMLIELGVAHELQLVDLSAGEQKSADYARLNPNRLVPTLVVDGQPMYECAALLLLLAERHPEGRLAPAVKSVERMAYLQWMLHCSNTVQAAFRGWFHPEEFAGGEAQSKELARLRIEAGWDRVDARLAATGAYLAGPEVSAADLLGTMLMRWSRNMPRPATGWPAIRDYVARMKARPSFRTLYEREGLTDWT